jgi:hypothetical protein
MTKMHSIANTTLPRNNVVTACWISLTVIACLWAFWANGVPLIYDDTGSYLYLGQKCAETLARMIGVSGELAVDAPGGGSGLAERADGQVKGSGAIIYGIFLAIIEFIYSYNLVVYVQTLALIVTLHISICAALRSSDSITESWMVTAFAAIAATAGCLSFYVAFLMPDIFTPILILAVAALATLGRYMRYWEGGLLILIAAAAVPMHLSHMIILALLLPAVVLVTLVTKTQRWWIAAAIVVTIGVVGVVERVAFSTAVEKSTKSEVVYVPYITARLIVDGPGKRYLDEKCPEVGLATCDLNAVLDRPSRVTGTHITFGVGDEAGSFELLPPETQKRISKEQIRFLTAVALDRPFELSFSVLGNVVEQLESISMYQTIPKPFHHKRARSVFPDFPAEWEQGRLAQSRDWIQPLTNFHSGLYIVSAIALLVLTCAPGNRVPAAMRGFAVLIGLGILANAFVCGALSQSADRYGARVMFLLPMAVVILWFARAHASRLSPR